MRLHGLVENEGTGGRRCPPAILLEDRRACLAWGVLEPQGGAPVESREARLPACSPVDRHEQGFLVPRLSHALELFPERISVFGRSAVRYLYLFHVVSQVKFLTAAHHCAGMLIDSC